jgi:hypothetical protein
MFFSSCTKDSDVEYPVAKKTLFFENFNNSLNALPYTFNETDWTTYAQTGTKKWLEKSYKNNGYATFSSFQSGEPVNVSWLISPAINMDTQDGEKLYFQTCQDGYVKNTTNSLELYVSTDYDGTNFNNASWQKVSFNVANANTTKYVYVNSGFIDLSSYTGTIHFAFKYFGTSSLSGGYQVDNIRIFY